MFRLGDCYHLSFSELRPDTTMVFVDFLVTGDKPSVLKFWKIGFVSVPIFSLLNSFPE